MVITRRVMTDTVLIEKAMTVKVTITTDLATTASIKKRIPRLTPMAMIGMVMIRKDIIGPG